MDLEVAFRIRLSEYVIESFRSLTEEDIVYVIHAYVEARYPDRIRQSRRSLFRVTDLGVRRILVLEHVIDRDALARAWKNVGPSATLAILVETDAAHPDEVDVR